MHSRSACWLDGPKKRVPSSRTPDPDSLWLEPTTHLGDPARFQAQINIQPVLSVAQSVSSSLPRRESPHSEGLHLIPIGRYGFRLSVTWRFSICFCMASQLPRSTLLAPSCIRFSGI